MSERTTMQTPETCPKCGSENRSSSESWAEYACGTEVMIGRRLDGSDKIERTAECEANEADRTIARLTAELASVKKERDWAALLAKAVLGCSISTYEACDQTIAIHSNSEMIWALWDGHGELENDLPKETPDLRARIEAAISSMQSVDDAQGMRIELANVKAERDELRAKLAAIEAKLSSYPINELRTVRECLAILHPTP